MGLFNQKDLLDALEKLREELREKKKEKVRFLNSIMKYNRQISYKF